MLVVQSQDLDKEGVQLLTPVDTTPTYSVRTNSSFRGQCFDTTSILLDLASSNCHATVVVTKLQSVQLPPADASDAGAGSILAKFQLRDRVVFWGNLVEDGMARRVPSMWRSFSKHRGERVMPWFNHPLTACIVCGVKGFRGIFLEGTDICEKCWMRS
ncbi:hypothetical protein K440DRAFT_637649 [Wilcoxina mikolae CBS 423.85]|nr:hypothetical protein K440DRAFT_637649 [Wilcoxina mikolae CBS 423.85]